MARQQGAQTYRRFPRTVTEAFGLDATSANPITHYGSYPIKSGGVYIIMIIIIIALFSLAVLWK